MRMYNPSAQTVSPHGASLHVFEIYYKHYDAPAGNPFGYLGLHEIV